jgi:hypothetical protein
MPVPRSTDYTTVEVHKADVRAVSAGTEDGDFVHLYVDGVRKELNYRGHNLVVVDESTGNYIESRRYDTYGSSSHADAMATYINSLKIGATTGAGWGLVTSQQFQNLLKGEGWVSDNQIWQRYVQSHEINAGLEKFDLPGTYDPSQFTGSELAMTDVNGNIYYNDTAIGHIDRIRALAAKESFHQHRYNSNSLLFQKDEHFRVAPEEALGFRELYYKQGHFPNSQIKPLPNIRLYEFQIKKKRY